MTGQWEYRNARWGFACHAVALAGLIFVAGCASKDKPKPAAPSQPASRPVPPAGAASNLTLPDGDGQGGFRTINDGLGRDEAVWHLRSALNVAALSCVGTGSAALVANYNALLGQKKAVFAAGYAAENARHRAGGNAALDGHMTKLYNYFAQPPAQAAFCAVARDVANEARSVAAAAFPTFAVEALARLDRPFDDFYRAYAAYQRDLAAWQTGARTAKAVAAPVALAASAAPLQPVAGVQGDWRIQLGAFSGEAAAEAAWGKIRSRMAGVASFKPRFDAVPGKPLVRVQVGPVTDRADAIRLCAAAASAGFDCFPVVPPARSS
ncbi:sporulation domain-containing protein [Sphingomonas sp. KC8]|nr:SPOR domain-containing protein [Sphingomonas sp. KC8]ARS26518.1 sporulation domain-containing protein [Sphingomonas sp. KC8]